MRKQIWTPVVAVLILSVLILTTACAQKKVTQTEPASQPEPQIQKKETDNSKEDAKLAEQLLQEKLREETAKQVVEEKKFDDQDIYFAFDSSDLSDQARQILSNNAEYLLKHSGLTVTVEGHCDERGSETYNNSLGKRRAESVKNFLLDKGISTDRLVTVSYGESKPIAFGSNEASWAKNRRVQIVVNLASNYPKAAMN
jgi:peptidoglycan-associated lipoprotein